MFGRQSYVMGLRGSLLIQVLFGVSFWIIFEKFLIIFILFENFEIFFESY